MPKPDMSKDYLWAASANAALSRMFKRFLTLSAADTVNINAAETANYNQMKLTTPEPVLIRSRAFGQAIAEAIYSWSLSDNFNLASTGYTLPPHNVGDWVPTALVAPFIVGPYLQNSRPMLQYSLTATAPPLPIPFSTSPGSAFFLAAKEVYDIGNALTIPQKAIANWWADAGGAGTGVPAPYHILSIITGLLESQNAGLWKAAEVYAKTGIGLKDGPIITFRAKYQYMLLRPITYIRLYMVPAAPTWNSFLGAPPYPEYTSGLISNYGPVVQVLIRELGDLAVSDNAYSWRGDAPRTYNSLTDLLAEAALSRVYAGIHYRFTQNVSIDMGVALGNEIANMQIVGPKY
jgi:hypothetical protein